MIYNRYSSSVVLLADDTKIYCENTVDDIKNQMSSSDTVVLDLTDENKEISVNKIDIKSFGWTD